MVTQITKRIVTRERCKGKEIGRQGGRMKGEDGHNTEYCMYYEIWNDQCQGVLKPVPRFVGLCLQGHQSEHEPPQHVH